MTARPLRPRRGPSGPLVLVLLSGGIDSAATLAVYRRQMAEVSAVHFDYGQPARRSEWEAAEAIAGHYGVPITRIRLGVRPRVRDGEFFGRNALFVLAAAATVGQGPLVIAAGLHTASPYYDTTSAFVGDLQRILDGYAGGSVTFAAPFLETTKKDIVQYARRHRVPLRLTYSCERRNAPPCGACFSCLDRKDLRVD
jgi:7-cyano-7-deazaguanine synthase